MASARYIMPSGPQAEYEPGSHRRVLRNRLGIRRAGEMAEAEYAALLEIRLKYMNRVAADTRFTAALVCQMHRDWLGGIYEWAGCYRSVEIQKGDFRWPPAYLVAQNMQRLEEGALRRSTPCRSGSISHVAQQVAEVHAELLLIHPFREGNGRLARWLADVMVLQAGLRIPRYGFRGRGSQARRQRYLEAVRRGYLGEYELLAAFFAEAIDRALAPR
ncbi:MAG: Fic family protein [Planctomycetota bacterium]|nr:Fic family protein [Planctomycetota bacterium]